MKPGVDQDDVDVALAEMCNVVKETYGGDKGGFIAGQVFRFSGFVSDEGLARRLCTNLDHDIAIVTYWRSFEEHERSHADAVFREKFAALARSPWARRNWATSCCGRASPNRRTARPAGWPR